MKILIKKKLPNSSDPNTIQITARITNTRKAPLSADGSSTGDPWEPRGPAYHPVGLFHARLKPRSTKPSQGSRLPWFWLAEKKNWNANAHCDRAVGAGWLTGSRVIITTIQVHHVDRLFPNSFNFFVRNFRSFVVLEQLEQRICSRKFFRASSLTKRKPFFFSFTFLYIKTKWESISTV